jgi:uncharacterized OsmC-like protein
MEFIMVQEYFNENERIKENPKSKHTMLNGVDVTEMEQMIIDIKDDPYMANFTFRASNDWINGANSRTRLDSFYGAGKEWEHEETFIVEADEPKVMLGTDKAASPGELVLTALASCLATSVSYHGAAKDIKIESIKGEYEGDVDLQGFLGLNTTVNKGFKEINVSLKVKTSADESIVADLVKMSPVYEMLTNPVKVNLEIQTF